MLGELLISPWADCEQVWRAIAIAAVIIIIILDVASVYYVCAASHGSHGNWKMKMEKSWNINKNGQKSRNFIISHGILPILSENYTNFIYVLPPLRHFPTFFFWRFLITPWMQNREEKWSWKIKKWSWKSHGKIFCQVCGNSAICLSCQFHGPMICQRECVSVSQLPVSSYMSSSRAVHRATHT